MIGERVNTLGSRKVKRLLLDDNYDGVVEVAREQALARVLRPLLAGTRVVVTHAYEGGHPDHDAVAFAVHAAVAEVLGAADALGDDDIPAFLNRA